MAAKKIEKSYRNAVNRYNRARGKKSGDKGYITPSQALKHKRKFKDTAAVEAQIEKYKYDKKITKLASAFNKFRGYIPGEAGYMTKSNADYAYKSGVLEDAVENAKNDYTKEIKKEAEYKRKVRQSIKDEKKLKEIAKELNALIADAGEKHKEMTAAETEEEYERLKAEHVVKQEKYKDVFMEMIRKERELKNKYRKANKMTELKVDAADDEELRSLNAMEMQREVRRILSGMQGRDQYGKQQTLFEFYHNIVTDIVNKILSATFQTTVRVDGQEMSMSDIININTIDNKKFWRAYHAWEHAGGLVVPKNGAKYPNYVPANEFFSTKEGTVLFQDLLKSEYAGSTIDFI